MFAGIVLLIFLITIICVLVIIFKKVKKSISTIEIILSVIYILSLFLFLFGLIIHSAPFYIAIDPVDLECYSPFSNKHYPTLLLYGILFNISSFLIWQKGRKLPPLTLVLSLIFLCIGSFINFAILFQITGHNTESLDIYKGNDGILFFILAPIVSLLISILLITKIIMEEKTESQNRTYQNSVLNYCNTFLAKKMDETVWALILLFPVFLLITIILTLFGQETDSIIKVFTDTTTWTFSQKSHPPILDHKGHYLCTVAAKGNPKIVKPVRLGKRHGKNIIVNRQLQIANAFEEMIQDFSPKMHHLIRTNYDNYGYNLSKNINTEIGSNITYFVMKPLEWFFLICLYSFCNTPEQKITKQYKV
ncbi:DUF6688 domain-containing protein [Aquimarina muelleri]|uniref:Uncharacterized protein n=1 Tax=Aquimarina muelleri TaxID=279356 RepID=A0A918JYR4_9FLAO|nr:DUF6688 family protein [Aquimarina muelleri]MCX2764813.1 hypothetical protein [Aquimarina muelleri]GGX34105.1 hypothetical protein GCM10007384_38450 [Aquimarina muelleri]